MIRTLVCEKQGCNGNSFNIESKDNKMILTCKECKSIYELSNEAGECKVLSNCSHCSGEFFKVFKDIDNKRIYAKCIECGNPPEQLYLDLEGNQVSYEGKLLIDIKEKVLKMEQKIWGLEEKLGSLENGQELIEQSLAYINKYVSQ